MLCIPMAWYQMHLTTGRYIIASVWLYSFSLTGHYGDVIMRAIASQITDVSMVCSTVCSGVDKKTTPKLLVIGLCEGNSTVTGEASNAEMFRFDGAVMGIMSAVGPVKPLHLAVGRHSTVLYDMLTGLVLTIYTSWDIMDGSDNEICVYAERYW